MGHFMQSLALSNLFILNKFNVHFLINSYNPALIVLHKKKITFNIHDINAIDEIIFSIKTQSKNTIVIINHRNISIISLKRLHRECYKIVVIDELGNKEMQCDLLINSSLIAEWKNYKYIEKKPICLFGAKFAILRSDFTELHKRKKEFPVYLQTIIVTMGGVDRSGATLRVIEALERGNKNPIRKEIILGKGFPHIKKLKEKFGNSDSSSLNYFEGVDDLGERLSKADLVISSGGSTIYELACVGTPGLILWEDEHENKQGKIFEEKGTVINLGNGLTTEINTIADAVRSLLFDKDKRIFMSKKGKVLVDGRGIYYIYNSIINFIK